MAKNYVTEISFTSNDLGQIISTFSFDYAAFFKDFVSLLRIEIMNSIEKQQDRDTVNNILSSTLTKFEQELTNE